MTTAIWTLTLQCPECNARVTWQNERPEWQTDEEIVQGIDAARDWVARRESGENLRLLDAPLYVHSHVLHNIAWVEAPETRYILCPCCDAHIRPQDWPGDEEDTTP